MKTLAHFMVFRKSTVFWNNLGRLSDPFCFQTLESLKLHFYVIKTVIMCNEIILQILLTKVIFKLLQHFYQIKY